MPESGPETITSPANATIKRLVRMRDNRFRRRSQRLLVDGWRESARAIEAGLTLVGCYVGSDSWPPTTDSWSVHDREAAEIIRGAVSGNAAMVRISESLFERIGYGQSPRGIVTEFVEPDRQLTQLRLPADPLVLVLDGIEKPGNLGAIFRCADAAGVDAVILSSCECDLHNPNAIRSSLGAVFSVPAAAATREAVHDFLVQQQIRPLAARVESSQPLWSVPMSGRLAILVGSESRGLGEHWQTIASNASIESVRIPMAGQVDSLNVSVSAALLVYEAVRKRSLDEKTATIATPRSLGATAPSG